MVFIKFYVKSNIMFYWNEHLIRNHKYYFFFCKQLYEFFFKIIRLFIYFSIFFPTLRGVLVHRMFKGAFGSQNIFGLQWPVLVAGSGGGRRWSMVAVAGGGRWWPPEVVAGVGSWWWSMVAGGGRWWWPEVVVHIRMRGNFVQKKLWHSIPSKHHLYLIEWSNPLSMEFIGI